MKSEKGLGDRVESAIKMVAPAFYEKRKGCASCLKRKVFLNKLGRRILK